MGRGRSATHGVCLAGHHGVWAVGHHGVWVEDLFARRTTRRGILAQQLLDQLPPYAVLVAGGEPPPVHERAERLRRTGRVGDPDVGQIAVPVGDPDEAEEQSTAADGNVQPLPQLEVRVLRDVTWARGPFDPVEAHVLGPRPAVQQRPDAGGIGVPEVLAHRDQTQSLVVHDHGTPQARGECVHQCLNLLNTHAPLWPRGVTAVYGGVLRACGVAPSVSPSSLALSTSVARSFGEPLEGKAPSRAEWASGTAVHAP